MGRRRRRPAPTTHGATSRPAVHAASVSFDRADLDAFAEGTRSPASAPASRWPPHTPARRPPPTGKLRLFDEVTEFDPDGGPWGRGYLRATAAVPTDDWFFDGHFKNDPCMPGTLMFEGPPGDVVLPGRLRLHHRPRRLALRAGARRDGALRLPGPGDARHRPHSSPTRCSSRDPRRPDADDLRAHCSAPSTVSRCSTPVGSGCGSSRTGRCRRARRDPVRDPGRYQRVRGDHGALLACGGACRPRRSARCTPRSTAPAEHRACPASPTTSCRASSASTARPGCDQGRYRRRGVRRARRRLVLRGTATRCRPDVGADRDPLQPCGWLSSYIGFAANRPDDVVFRNLDGGEVVLHKPATRRDAAGDVDADPVRGGRRLIIVVLRRRLHPGRRRDQS